MVEGICYTEHIEAADATRSKYEGQWAMSGISDNQPQASSASATDSIVTSGRLHDGAIVTFALKGNPTRALVDQWFDLVAVAVASWPAERVYLALHDFSDERVAFTHYARVRVKEFEPLVAHLHGRIALVLTPNLQGQIIRIALRSFRWQKKIRTEAFFTYAEALRFLEAALPGSNIADQGKSANRHIPW